MDALVDGVRAARAEVDAAGARLEAAAAAHAVTVAAVVADEVCQRGAHGAQARAARRLGVSAQRVGAVLSAAGYDPRTGESKSGG